MARAFGVKGWLVTLLSMSVLLLLALSPVGRPVTFLTGCYCSKWIPALVEANDEAQDEAAEDFGCPRNDVMVGLASTAHNEQATIRARGCDQTATYDCWVSCGDWKCRRAGR